MRLPSPPKDDVFLRELTRTIQQADTMNFKRNQDLEIGQNSIILTSPNGTRYAIIVDNAGNLSTSLAP